MRGLKKIMAFLGELSWVGRAGLVLILGALVLALVAFFFLETPEKAAEAQARAKLQLVLDSWKAQTAGTKLQEDHPAIVFTDARSMDIRLLDYEILSARSLDRDAHEFDVKLLLKNKAGKEVNKERIYTVAHGKTPEGKEVWPIAGRNK